MKQPSSRTSVLTLVLALALADPALASDTERAAAGASAEQRAARLVAELRAELAPVEDQIRNARFLADLEAGAVPREKLRAFAADQFQVLESDLRSAGQLVARFGGTPSGPFFKNILEGEVLARDLMLRFGAALGMSEEDLERFRPRPGAQTYPSYVTAMSVHGSDAEVATAFLLNFAVFGENTGRMARALRSRYGFTAEETAFFDFFAELPPDFDEDATAVIVHGLKEGADVGSIKRSVRLLQAYEKMFWDAMSR